MELFAVSPEIFASVILPILIFIARLVDVTMATVRIIFISKGIRLLAALIGFFEVLIWIIVVSQIMQDMGNFINMIAYAAGFATGNYMGMVMEERISLGMASVRIITKNGGSRLRSVLRSAGYKVTTVSARGTNGPVKIIYTAVRRKRLKSLIDIIRRTDPEAFYSFGDIRSATEEPHITGNGSMSLRSYLKRPSNRLRMYRKGR